MSIDLPETGNWADVFSLSEEAWDTYERQQDHEVEGEFAKRPAFADLARRGVIESDQDRYLVAILLPEPDNAYDPNAVAVLVAGNHVGYIDKYMAPFVKARIGTAPLVAVAARVWARNDNGIWRARVTVNLSFWIPGEETDD